MYSPMELAEMVNSANYASMSYGELVTINFALHLAIGEVKPLVEIKKQEEMAVHTQEYVAKMKRYCATKEEILANIEKEMVETTPNYSTTQHDVDDQAPIEDSENDQEKGEEVLALPSPTTSIMDDIDLYEYWESLAQGAPQEDESQSATPEHEEGERNLTELESVESVVVPVTDEAEPSTPIVPETSEPTLVEKVIEMTKTLPVPQGIDVNSPYFVERIFKSDLTHNGTHGRNLSVKDLDAFRSASYKYVTLFLKEDVLVSTDEYLVSKEDDDSIKVKMYCFPEENSEVSKTLEPTTISDNNCVSEETLKELKKKNSRLKKAIKLAKEYSFSDETDAQTPFYDKYIFTLGRKNKLELKKERIRVYEDVTTLTELMPAFETYARLFNERYMVLSKDNCVAATPSETIYLVLFNIPAQKQKRHVTRKSKSVNKDVQTAEESPLVSDVSTDQVASRVISQAVKMTRALPVSKGTDVNTPYYIQQEYVITKDGDLFPEGKSFSTNISIDTLEKNKSSHRKLASAMKASALVCEKDFTAYIRNGGKNVCVYSYHV